MTWILEYIFLVMTIPVGFAHVHVSLLKERVVRKHKGEGVFAYIGRYSPTIFWKKAEEFPEFIEEWNEKVRNKNFVKNMLVAIYLLLLFLTVWVSRYSSL